MFSIISLFLILGSQNIILVQGIGTIVPLYLYPQVINGVHNWQSLIDAASTHKSVDVWAIVNPNSGPGTLKDASYVDAINRLKNSGIHTLGYVSTRYAARSSTEVQQEINKWKSLYSPNGIFFDEMKYERCSTCVNYYSSLDKYAKSLNFTFTVGNPGTDTLPEYTSTVDTIMIYEKPSLFPTTNDISGWHSAYPIHKWGVFPYNIVTLNSNSINVAKEYVGYIYATNDNLPNPWDSIPPYLNQLLDILACD